ncbi:MAG: hypothetical protein U1F67_16510 [Rubrivivax sp.]
MDAVVDRSSRCSMRWRPTSRRSKQIFDRGAARWNIQRLCAEARRVTVLRRRGTELGYPKLEALGWMGLWCPPDVPPAVQARLREAALKVLSLPVVRERLLELGFDLGAPRPVADIEAGLKADYERVGAVLQSIGFKPE